MVSLGLSYGHGDSSAALVIDGCLVAAAEEERFSRIKHDAGFPSLAIAYCLRHAGLQGSDVTTVAIARKPFKHWFRKARLIAAHPALLDRPANHTPPTRLAVELRALGIKASVLTYEHHYAHLMSSRFLSKDDSQAYLSIDGLGDFVSVMMGKPQGNGIEVVKRVFFPDSLGFFYTALTQFLGFPHYGDEFKVMGLSSYGSPQYAHAMRELVREKTDGTFYLNPEAFPILKKPIQMTVEKSQPKIKPFYSTPFLTQLIGLPPRKSTDPLTAAHRNLAASVQARFEEIANRLVGTLHEKVPAQTLALSGGCAHNSVWVGKIPKRTPFHKVVVAPASHDGGLAVGAAIAAAQAEVTPESGHWALLGPDLSEVTGPSELPHGMQKQEFSNRTELAAWMAEQLSQGKILGLVDGRLEFGPRALGSRSILADPRRAEMKQRLNDRVKHREPFRPFAASVLAEHQTLWFENVFESPTMEAVFEVNPEVKERIGGVVHADGTCRIQSVHKETQGFYWELIEAFRKKTGIPMLLNTSFNDSEPIVCTPQDALRCFQNTDMDAIVIGQTIYTKAASSLTARA
ncbi:carbamoyltransferase [bacterium]|nr:carbamoyltransferase [bacterium]